MTELRNQWRVKVSRYRSGHWHWECAGHWQNGYPEKTWAKAYASACDHAQRWHPKAVSTGNA